MLIDIRFVRDMVNAIRNSERARVIVQDTLNGYIYGTHVC
jgi:hypothetical protein